MTQIRDSYKTLKRGGEPVLFKDRGSKFIGQAHPVLNEKQIEEILAKLWSEHAKASHICYAWLLGANYEDYRANDDGEPKNSAGLPIYGQLQAFELTNTLITVVRYYGGTNLGVGGLIQAYKASAQLAIEASQIVTKTIKQKLFLDFDYPLMHTVMRIIKEEQLKVETQEMALDCKFTLLIRKKDFKRIKKRFEAVYGLNIKT
ncbi:MULTISPECIES: YigZ family protein [unclassified Leeuwenhoekiella]|uniref:IMPACT family protein n=1 Tax=unclassified Leeuwenhoekiella TaxID=2615029 RepID=UPI000C688593|nr:MULTISPECIES: YigZ family protein [unclassified Leeuwenhoekiella]MAW94630.1 YigZ family protein [Leeuwenhoekiella sp.]MBA82053.1 YigZ family protein [Leeuwenhoekiella sp.]|tara:strand:- start:47267 stop:47875 length:609 start_codon:yes stop_codon:yes gene_type:complete